MDASERRLKRPGAVLLVMTTICSFASLFTFALFLNTPYVASFAHREAAKRATGAPSIAQSASTESVTSPLYNWKFPKVAADVPKQEAVKEAFLHAWNSYANKCFGHDELHPLSHGCSDTLHGGLTIIDSISTIVLMNLTEPYERVRRFVKEDFAPNGGWSLFEFIIRYLGGLLSAAELTGDEVFTNAAVKVGYALLPIMQKTGGFYNSRFSFQTNEETKEMSASGGTGSWNLAEVGTFQVEFLTLAKITGDVEFVKCAMNVYNKMWAGKSSTGLMSPGVGAGEDSYYEYVIKSYLLTGGVSSPMLHYYLNVARDIKKNLVFHTLHQNLTGIGPRGSVDMEPTMEHLATFAGGMLAIGAVVGNEQAVEDLELAGRLATTFATVYKTMKSGVMAEQMKYNARNPGKDKDFWVYVDEYILRPESVESVYIMWKFTGLQKYRDYAWDMFKGINRSCRVPGGFAAITGVDSDRVRHKDSMESFFLAETLKYLYLTFSDSSLISPTEWVFNTEAHPVRMWDKDTIEKFRKLLTDLPS